jgi:mxaJ protein
MSSACLKLMLGALVLCASPAAARELRVCADPNNLPFSDANGGGFENKVAAIIAREIGADLSYVWWAQRRGFVRNTLKAGLCDLVPGIAASVGMLRTTRPYYRSGYVFVTREADGDGISSLDDPRLRHLRIGVQLIGDDGANTPPVEALAKRGLAASLRGYPIYGDYAREAPAGRIIAAVADGDVDVAVVWGPTAGFFARRSGVPLRLSPVRPLVDPPMLPMAFDIAMGLRREDAALRTQIERALIDRKADIDATLAAYGVPRLDTVRQAGATGP